jgi:hypothetical protein
MSVSRDKEGMRAERGLRLYRLRRHTDTRPRADPRHKSWMRATLASALLHLHFHLPLSTIKCRSSASSRRRPRPRKSPCTQESLSARSASRLLTALLLPPPNHLRTLHRRPLLLANRRHLAAGPTSSFVVTFERDSGHLANTPALVRCRGELEAGWSYYVQAL